MNWEGPRPRGQCSPVSYSVDGEAAVPPDLACALSLQNPFHSPIIVS